MSNQNQNQNQNQEFVIRFNKTTLIGVGLIMVLFTVIIMAMVGTFAYMAKPIVISPTTIAPQPAPASGDITAGNNEPTLVFPTAIINGATPPPEWGFQPGQATTERVELSPEQIETLEAEMTAIIQKIQQSTPQPTATYKPYEATAETGSGKIDRWEAMQAQQALEYAEAMKKNECVPSQIAKDTFTCPNALLPNGSPDFCILCHVSGDGCPDDGVYYYCLNTQVKVDK